MNKNYRENILKELSFTLLVAMPPLLLLSLSRIFTEGFYKVMIVHIFCSVLIIINFLTLEKIKPYINQFFIVLLFTLISFGSIFHNNNIVFGQAHTVIVMILVALFFEFKWTFAYFIFSILSHYLISIYYLSEVKHLYILGTSVFSIIATRSIFLMRKSLELSAKNETTARELSIETLNSKELFFSMLTHEMRTPLIGIINGVDILKSSDLNKDQQDLIEIIDFSNKLLLSISNDILDLNKLEQKKVTLNFEKVNLQKLLENVISSNEKTANNKGISLKSHLQIPIDFSVYADDIRLIQILNNLLSNSIKFTDKGSVQLNLKIENMQIEDKVNLHFEIIDTGIGISEENIQNIFRPFTQENSNIAKKFGGTGLGLAICKQLIELFEGSIEIKSEKNQGSIFSFNIPVKISHQSPKEISDSVSGIAGAVNNLINTYKPHVLVAEDNLINQKIIKLILKKEGIEAVFVNNGQEAVEQITLNHFDIIFMDAHMPILDGIDATKQIRQMSDSKKSDIFIVGCSATISETLDNEYITAGMDICLGKPIIRTNLQLVLMNYFVKKTLTQ